MGSESSKSLKNEVFRVLAKNLIHSDIYDFFFQHGSVNGLLNFGKTASFGKIWFLTYDPKTSRAIRMQDSLN